MKTQTEIDFSAHYTVAGYRGVAFYLKGYATTNEPMTFLEQDENGNAIEVESDFFELVEDRENVIAVMVGDDRKHTVSVDDLTLLDEEKFCHECGQVGCSHDGR